MKRITIAVFGAVLLAGLCSAQTSTGAQATTSAGQNTQLSPDKSGAQASSQTTATTSENASTQDVKSDGHVVLPKGTKVIGRVTQAQERTKGQEESQLGMAFDHAILKDGTQIPVAFTIQAIGRSESEAAAATAAETDGMTTGGNAGGMTSAGGNAGMQTRGGLAGVTTTAGGAVNSAGSAAGTTLNTAGSTSAGVTGTMGATSQGVVGLPGMTLSSAPSSMAGVGSVISSKQSNIRLDTGTRVILGVRK